jgi:hypothetical protein
LVLGHPGRFMQQLTQKSAKKITGKFIRYTPAFSPATR